MNFPAAPIRILWGSPLPPTRSGVADYAAELLPELTGLARIRVLAPDGWQPPRDWPPEVAAVPLDEPADAGEIVLLHLGNNPYHVPFFDRLLAEVGPVVVLHDPVLHHLLVEATVARGDPEAYRIEVAASHGAGGRALAAARGAGVLGRLDPFLFPARRSLLGRASAVVVHSDWAASAVAADLPDVPVGRVALPVADPGPVDRIAVRRQLGLDPDEIVVMHLGFLTPEKGLAEVIVGIGAAVSAGIPVRLVLVGEGSVEGAIRAAIEGGKLEDRVQSTGWVAPELFPSIPAAADLGVALRTPSAGETSASVLRFLACGVPVAVSGVRQYLEWPEAAAPRVTPGPSASAEIARLVGAVRSDGWRARRRAARAVYLGNHLPATAAHQLVDFLAGLT
ncbi:MAG: glycosyltransferase [Holophagae bacterium]